jgi:hypothetical protein
MYMASLHHCQLADKYQEYIWLIPERERIELVLKERILGPAKPNRVEECSDT